MNEQITGLYLEGDLSIREKSAAMKRLFADLFACGGVTYSQFLFPYADSLLLSGDSDDCFFGSHALLWQISPEQLTKCAEKLFSAQADMLSVRISQIEISASSIGAFLASANADAGCTCVGNFASLLSGNIRPWALREHSRGLCSFAEHIARQKGYTVYGFSGDRLAISSENEVDREMLTALYASKTGGIAEFIKY